MYWQCNESKLRLQWVIKKSCRIKALAGIVLMGRPRPSLCGSNGFMFNRVQKDSIPSALVSLLVMYFYPPKKNNQKRRDVPTGFHECPPRLCTLGTCALSGVTGLFATFKPRRLGSSWNSFLLISFPVVAFSKANCAPVFYLADFSLFLCTLPHTQLSTLHVFFSAPPPFFLSLKPVFPRPEPVCPQMCSCHRRLE